MSGTTHIEHVKSPGFERRAWISHPRADGDDYYWCISIDGGTYADGYAATLAEAEDHCREMLAEHDAMNA